jgi:hypothetical protein
MLENDKLRRSETIATQNQQRITKDQEGEAKRGRNSTVDAKDGQGKGLRRRTLSARLRISEVSLPVDLSRESTGE